MHVNLSFFPVSEESMVAIEGKLSLAECYEALQIFLMVMLQVMMVLRPTFYKSFWDLLGHQLTHALYYSYEHGELLD